MSLEAALCDVVATSTLGRAFYPAPLPEGVDVPAGTYFRVSTSPEIAHSGASNLDDVTFQISIFGEGYGEVIGHANSLVEAVQFYTNESIRDSDVKFFVTDVRDLPDIAQRYYQRIITVRSWVKDLS